jgi:hypothetical protein
MSAVVWRRYSTWAAHAHVDGKQACGQKHGFYMGFRGSTEEPKIVDLAPSGLPYGTVCQRCLKIVRARTQ